MHLTTTCQKNNKFNDSSRSPVVHWVSSTATVQDCQPQPHVSTEGRDNTYTDINIFAYTLT